MIFISLQFHDNFRVSSVNPRSKSFDKVFHDIFFVSLFSGTFFFVAVRIRIGRRAIIISWDFIGGVRNFINIRIWLGIFSSSWLLLLLGKHRTSANFSYSFGFWRHHKAINMVFGVVSCCLVEFEICGNFSISGLIGVSEAFCELS